MSVTMTTTGGPVLVAFSGSAVNSAASGDIYIALAVDGGTDNEITSAAHPSSGGRTSLSGSWPFLILAAGSHTFKVRWRVGGGGTGTPLNRNMTVVEFKR